MFEGPCPRNSNTKKLLQFEFLIVKWNDPGKELSFVPVSRPKDVSARVFFWPLKEYDFIPFLCFQLQIKLLASLAFGDKFSKLLDRAY